MKRPLPPQRLKDFGLQFEPAPRLEQWIRETFIDGSGPLLNPEHEHLKLARIGVLWTNAENIKRGMEIVGTAEMPFFRGDAWQKARQEYQIRQWFDCLPDFLITFSAPYAFRAPDDHWCAVSEHELLHCGQANDEFGFPKYTKSGDPKFTLRAHDFEQFNSIVDRYGPEASGLGRLVELFQRAPKIDLPQIRVACGAC